MGYLAYKIPVHEYEVGWGNKIDDYMVCLSYDECTAFKNNFNKQNNLDITPDWYMVVKDEPIAIGINESQLNYLAEHKNVWLSELKIVK